MHLSDLIRQKSYEKIVYRLRRHPITFVPIFGLFMVLVAVPIFLYGLIATLFPNLLTGPVSFPMLVLLTSMYLLAMYLFFYVRFLEYYLDVWVVTNDRVVDIEQFGLFSRTVTELDLFRIQDVTVDMHGLFPTLFNYGNILVKTASTNMDIVFREVPAPNVIRERLIELSKEDGKYHAHP